MQRAHAVPILAVIFAVAIAGCGGSEKQSPASRTRADLVSGNQRGILGTLAALQTASRKRDGRGICGELFTANFVKSVEKAAKRSCASEVTRNLFSRNTEISVARQIKVAGDQGTAVIREQTGNASEVSLLKESGRWRIDRVTPEETG